MDLRVIKDNGVMLECDFTKDMTDQEIQDYFKVKSELLAVNNLGSVSAQHASLEILYDADFCKENDIEITYESLEVLV